ncbi:MAG: 30S ribosomal protein S9 [Thaumarchaeota archaeon]|jgi:small subunit ribosomal protein S9|nr:30S ribosomal protein S9 [Candidatus Geocrenenecus arthurdayi]MCL7390242.1 30S ribosomal protein S9 [Candidatus Geocrenenecus arthurdayi]MCL7391988.1 30S ribosomal protein S9 [Candidatus Geocrenenecus arthurdayi]MCL7397385.1 30S ribosomal protein S9 [Candidatus Geocrenenecus arthurdayi]MCL7401931.1 30S ribosomal protein S9 [Candidatus Geocrenenecus arthurdayi]
MVKPMGPFVGRRKTAIARLFIRPGKGNIYINNQPITYFGNEIIRNKILTPLYFDEKFWKNHDFYVKVEGGGVMAIADAVSFALAKALASRSETVAQRIKEYNRVLLAEDPRQAEPKKPNRYSARRFKQKSYR